jgi:hypothetical protein
VVTEARLWRHLRTLNMVEIPRPAGIADRRTSEADIEELSVLEPRPEYDAVMFRHGDGNVLAEILPLLDAGQFRRFFGPASSLLFPSPNHPASNGSLIRRADLPDDAPAAPPGLLRLSRHQMEVLERRRRRPIEIDILKKIEVASPLSPVSGRRIDLDIVSHYCHLGSQELGLEADQHLMDYTDLLWRRGEAVRFDERYLSIINRDGFSREEKCRRLQLAFP